MRRIPHDHGLRSPMILVATALLLPCPFLPADAPVAPPSPPRVVVSGFEPFGGRKENASAELATALAKTRPGCRAVIVPVVWGAPKRVLAEEKETPDLWVAFGEGGDDFRIEIQADNHRADYPDNKNELPGQKEIIPGGGPLLNPIPAGVIAGELSVAGFPVSVSSEAGDYLCEEMLYTLLWQRQGAWKEKPAVLFIHLPVLGAAVKATGGAPAPVADREYLASFGEALFRTLARHEIPGGSTGTAPSP